MFCKHKKVNLFVVGSGFWMVLMFTGILHAGSHAASADEEYRIKAAFLLNFARFIEWPSRHVPREQAPFVFGFIGRETDGAWMKSLETQHIHGHPAIVKHFHNIEEIGFCHVLFIDRSMDKLLEKIIEAIGSKPIVCVGDSRNFALRGGMINFIKINDRLRFEMNLNAAHRSGLKISSRLLKLGRIIHDNSESDIENEKFRHLYVVGLTTGSRIKC